MIEHVWAKAAQCSRIDELVIATDDDRIAAAASGAKIVKTADTHMTGTDRIAEVVATSNHDIVVNIQGDQPLLDPTWVDQLVEAVIETPELAMATVAVPIRSESELTDPAVVKVVCDASGRAMYFSRSAIPHVRDASGKRFGLALHHVGLYAYRREVLLALAGLAPTPLEQAEKLEQLRALENGISIGVVQIEGEIPLEVDTPGDLERARRIFQELEPTG